MKKLTFILLSILMIVTFVACGDKECEHAYDNACDINCNECGEERTVTHDWEAADCVTAKTCKVCGATDGKALGHKPAEDDGDCTTEVKCSVCGEVTTAAKAEHIAHADDGDCTTPATCTACDQIVVEAKSHDFSGDWESDENQHWHVCQNEGCNVAETKGNHQATDDGNCTTAQKCTVCDEVVVEAIDGHIDSDRDYSCDNPGCQISVNPPKDPNPGINLPIDIN